MIQVRNEAFWPIRIFHRYTIMIRIQYAHSQLFTPIHWFFESLFVYNPPAGSSSGWVIIRPGHPPAGSSSGRVVIRSFHPTVYSPCRSVMQAALFSCFRLFICQIFFCFFCEIQQIPPAFHPDYPINGHNCPHNVEYTLAVTYNNWSQ